MEYHHSGLQLPRIRKLLQTNLVDIKCLVDLTAQEKVVSRKKHKKKFLDSKARVTKSGQQTPNNLYTFREIDLSSFPESRISHAQSPINLKVLKEKHDNKGTEQVFKKLNAENLLPVMNNFSKFRRGMSGSTISKLHWSRYQLKNSGTFKN